MSYLFSNTTAVVFACTASAMNDASEVRDLDHFAPGRPAAQYFHFGYGHRECRSNYAGAVMVVEAIKQLLLRGGVGLLPENGSVIDFGDGPFPERYEIACAVSGEPTGGSYAKRGS